MASSDLSLSDVPSLQQLVLLSLPDCLVVKSWSGSDELDADAAAARLGALLMEARRTLASLMGADPDLLLSIESRPGTLICVPVGPDLAAALLFEPSAPMGLVRVHARDIAERIRASARRLPSPSAVPSEPQNHVPAPSQGPSSARPKRPRALRLLELRLRQAGDASAVQATLARIAVDSEIHRSRLERGEALGADELERLERALERLSD